MALAELLGVGDYGRQYRDLKKAKALLDELGAPDGHSGAGARSA
jgi:hypothetical protein